MWNLIFLFLTLPVFALPKSVGADRLQTPPDGECYLRTGDRIFCSGTIANTPQYSKAKLITAAHCFEAVNGQEITAHCGCSETGCKETFQISNPILGSSNIVSSDHAIADLDHQPTIVTPVKSGSTNEIFDEKGLLKDGWTCIKGGHGITSSNDTKSKSVARFYSANGIQIKRNEYETTLEENSQFINSNSYNVAVSSVQSCHPLVAAYPLNMQSGLLIASLREIGIQFNSVTPGDSGAGLFCKNGEEPFRIIGIASQGTVTQTDLSSSDYKVQNKFATLPEKWSSSEAVIPPKPF